MNNVVLMGRLTRDPEVKYTQGENPRCVARYTLAVNRRFKRDGEQEADFINCVVFGKSAELTEKYFRKRMHVTINGQIQTGSYTNKDGNKVYTTEVVVEEQEFAESKNASGNNGGGYQQEDRPAPGNASADGFMDIPTGLTGNDLPFK